MPIEYLVETSTYNGWHGEPTISGEQDLYVPAADYDALIANGVEKAGMADNYDNPIARPLGWTGGWFVVTGQLGAYVQGVLNAANGAANILNVFRRGP